MSERKSQRGHQISSENELWMRRLNYQERAVNPGQKTPGDGCGAFQHSESSGPLSTALYFLCEIEDFPQALRGDGLPDFKKTMGARIQGLIDETPLGHEAPKRRLEDLYNEMVQNRVIGASERKCEEMIESILHYFQYKLQVNKVKVITGNTLVVNPTGLN